MSRSPLPQARSSGPTSASSPPTNFYLAAALDLRRETLFFLKRPILAALSRRLFRVFRSSFFSVSSLAAAKAFRAVRMRDFQERFVKFFFRSCLCRLRAVGILPAFFSSFFSSAMVLPNVFVSGKKTMRWIITLL